MCTVVWHVARRNPGPHKAVLWLATSLREAELVDTAERLERAYDREVRFVLPLRCSCVASGTALAGR